MAIIPLDSGGLALKMKAPPPNVGDEEYAKAWRENEYQVTEGNYCFSYENPGHGLAQCKYLNPALHNSDCHPDPNLRFYKDDENNGKLGINSDGPRRSKKGKTRDRTQVIKTEPSDIVGNNARDVLFPFSARQFEVGGNNAQTAPFPVLATPFEMLGNNAQAASFQVSALQFEVVRNNAQVASFPVSARPFEMVGDHTQAAPFVVTIPRPGITGNHVQNASSSTENIATLNVPRHRRAVTMGRYRHLANKKDCFIDYHE